MIKRHLITTVIIGVAIFLVSAAIYAKSVPDVIPLKDPTYKKHKKGIVQFDHKKHWDDYSQQYPEFYPSQCGECHHDKDGNPLAELGKTDLEEGGKVEKCITCHKTPAEAPKGKKAKKKLSKKEKIKEYHAEALHANCKGCHKKFNKKYKPKKAPTTCAKCHPKKKK